MSLLARGLAIVGIIVTLRALAPILARAVARGVSEHAHRARRDQWEHARAPQEHQKEEGA